MHFSFLRRDGGVSAVAELLLHSCGVKVTTVIPQVWKAFDHQNMSPSIVTHSFVRQVLRKNCRAYRNYSSAEKLELLNYCLSDKDYSDLHGLNLLPVISGEFIQFSAKATACYLCTQRFPQSLLPNIHHLLVDPADCSLRQHLENVAMLGYTQLKMLTEKEVGQLLQQYMPSSGYPSDWLPTFWNWVQSHELSPFHDLPLVPVGNNQLAKLTKSAGVVFVHCTSTVSPHLASALDKHHVRLAQEQQSSYLRHSKLLEYLHQFSGPGVLDAISCSTTLNERLVSVEASAFQELLCGYCTSICQRLSVFCNLAIFYTIQQPQGSFCYSINQVSCTSTTGKAIAEADNYNIKTELMPQNPLILSQAGNQRRLLEAASSQISFMNKMDFLCQVLFPMVRNRTYPQQAEDRFMMEVLNDFCRLTSTYKKQRDVFIQTIQSLPFLKNSKGQQKCPRELFDFSNSDLRNLFKSEAVFPAPPFNQVEYLHPLRECGLRQLNSVTAQELVNIVEAIKVSASHQPVSCDSVRYERAKAVVNFLNTHFTCLTSTVTIASWLRTKSYTLHDALATLARDNSWLPVCSTPPTDYPSCVPWRGYYHQHLASSSTQLVALHQELNMSKLPKIVGSQVLFVEGCLPQQFAKSLSASFSTLATAAVDHLGVLIKHKGGISNHELERLVSQVYEFLNQALSERGKAIIPLQKLPSWVWVGGKRFASPESVALKLNREFRQDLQPFIFVVPSSLSRFELLLSSFGVESVVSHRQILSVLHNNNLQIIPAPQAWPLVMAILNWVVDKITKGCSIAQEHQVLVPFESNSPYPDLRPAKELVYTDIDYLDAMSFVESNALVHHKVTKQMAYSLGVTPLSKYLDIGEDIMEDAGQHEPLLQRLKNILRDYKDGLTIVKELLQNADDAGATELNIMLDARQHTTQKLFFPGMSGAHGPALVVHNNATFTDEDFQNITKLAGATKEANALKIGKFGYGFCSVYHMTDVPSFVSRDYLYIFDPTLKHLAEVVQDRSHPGKKVKLTSRIFAQSHQLAPYKDLFNFQPSSSYDGTIFRFPFRKFQSKISDNVYTEAKVEELKKDLKQHGPKLLLFLRNVSRITFSTILDGERCSQEQLVVRRHQIQVASCNASLNNITVQEGEQSSEHWLISTCEKPIMTSGKSEYSIASVACKLVKPEADGQAGGVHCVDGEIFCFLPLSVASGLPVHISANFAVINNRRGIWTSHRSVVQAEKEVEWNRSLMQHTVPQAYLELLKGLKHFFCTDQLKNYKFFSLWPLESQLKTRNPLENMVTKVFELISTNELFHSSSMSCWLTLQQSQFLLPKILSVKGGVSFPPQCVVSAVHHLKLPVVHLPTDYIIQIQKLPLQLNVKSMDQYDFVAIFFSHIHVFDSAIQLRNEVLLLILKAFSFEMDNQPGDVSLKDILTTHKCIPRSPDGRHLTLCQQLVNPKSELGKLFDPEDGKFPVKEFCANSALMKAMVKLGLITERLLWVMIIDCAKGIEDLYRKEKTKALLRVEQVIKCVKDDLEKSGNPISSTMSLASIRFLPVMAKPEGYPLPWKGEGCELQCGSELSIYEARSSHSLTPCLVGTQMAVVNTLPPTSGGCGKISMSVQKLLGICSKPSVDIVLRHFNCLVQSFEPKTIQRQSHGWVEPMCHAVYEFLENDIKQQKASKPSPVSKNLLQYLFTMASPSESDERTETEKTLRSYHDQSFIFVGQAFVKPSVVAKKWKVNGPYIYFLPDILATERRLTNALAVKEEFEAADLFSALASMYKNHPNQTLPEECHKVVLEILSELGRCKLPKKVDNVYLPDQSYRLHLACELSYNDTPWCEPDDDCVYVHKLLSRETALKIGVKPVRSRFLEAYSSNQQHFHGAPFGQREELICRIKNILQDYPLDATFLQELIQNADDAKATKVCIVLDKRKHQSKKVLSEHWQELKGPALLVWNDAEFTEDDLIGIQKLGLGSKQDNSESIGQFGIGFNVVYHITDCPSFLTGGNTLCIFDPHCRYAPGANELNPGRRYDKLNETFWNTFSDLRRAYLRDELPDLPVELRGGTLFRFPLRYTMPLVLQSELIEDKVSGVNILDAEKMHTKLLSWISQIKDSLLFLNHVTKVELFVITGRRSTVVLEERFAVHINESYKMIRSSFHKVERDFRQSRKPAVVNYLLSITSEKKTSKSTEEWFVQQGVGDLNSNNQKWNYINQKAPKHGIAALLSTSGVTTTPFRGKVFCFFPLPITSNLPVHLNGQFVLSSNRMSLWSSDESDENDRLIQALSSSYADFLVAARQHHVKAKKYCDADQLHTAIRKYYKMFPFWDLLDDSPTQDRQPISDIIQRKESSHPEKEWKVLAQAVFENLWAVNAPVLASVDQQHNESGPEATVKWHLLHVENDPFSQAYFMPGSISKLVENVLANMGMSITCAPCCLRSHFAKLNHALPETTSRGTFEFYVKFHNRILQSCYPCLISQTPFETADKFASFTGYITRISACVVRQYPHPPFRYPLLLTSDNYLRVFDEHNKVFCSRYFNLFPKSSSKFVHPALLGLILSPEYFLCKVSFDVISGVLKENLSPELVDSEKIDNTDELIATENLQCLWECLCDDSVIKCHQQSVMKNFALLPATNHYLYSAKSGVLPLVTPQTQYSKPFILLKSFGLPILDESVIAISNIEVYCLKMSDYSQVLKALYHFHSETQILNQLSNPDDQIRVLFNYFGNIYFRNDTSGNCLCCMKSLPLFKAVNGTYVSLSDKNIYIWPVGCCMAGFKKWAESESTVFLESKGDWRTLFSDISDLGGDTLHSRDVYTMFVFKAFHKLNADERREHLRYIKDVLFPAEKQELVLQQPTQLSILQVTSDRPTLNVFETCPHRFKQTSKFLQQLKQLPCLEDPQNGQILPIPEFSDPNHSVFQMFPKHFKFPSEEYRNDKWLQFFVELGLKSNLEANQFIDFCTIVASGNHPRLEQASDVLLKYLFSAKAGKWNDDPSLLTQIGNICFARVEILPQLKAPCHPQNRELQLTTLQGAALLSCASLVWTVKPVVNVPQLSSSDLPVHSDVQEWNKKLQESLGIVTKPKAEDVYRNILNISDSVPESSQLFTKYDPLCTYDPGSHSQSNQVHIYKLMSANLTYLCKRNPGKIKHLPLFKAVNGTTYTSIIGKDVYILPEDCCMTGFEKWAKPESVVFLEKKGVWRKFYSDISDLGGAALRSRDVYVNFVFKAFLNLSADERREHLQYIKDVLFQDDKTKTKEHHQFLQQLRQVPCLEDPNSGHVLPIYEFCNPNHSVFQMFPKHFKFPSKEYRNDKWLQFFVELGLKGNLEANQFIDFCTIVASGNHPRLEQASDVLLKYLFSAKAGKWHDDPSLLTQIGNICFARAEKLPQLRCIKAPCHPQNLELQLTTLQGAAVLSCARLVWTVKPVVNVPQLSPSDLPVHSDVRARNKRLQENLGMVTEPKAEDVYRNILNIAPDGSQLYTEYDPHYTYDPGSQSQRVQAMSANLTYLHRTKSEKIKHLPLFKAVSGSYTSVHGKKVYILPEGCCISGIEKWAKPESVVFLEEKGVWRKFYFDISDLGGDALTSWDVYMIFVFEAFLTFNADERREHLQYIKAVLFPNAKTNFLQRLRQVPCLEDPNSGNILAVHEFYNPNLSVFQMFPEHFMFPSKEYQEEEWLEFFIKLGLKTNLKANEFIRLCKIVASGNHPRLEQASDILLKYLFSVKAVEWHHNSSLLTQIGKVCFVRVEKLPHLSWIKAPCPPQYLKLQLTTLQGAAVLSCARLVWTVKPVVNVPQLSFSDLPVHSDVRVWNKRLQENLGMVTEPKTEDVYKNILNISNTGLASFQLFTKYNQQYTYQSDSQRDDIVQVVSANLSYLHERNSEKLKALELVSCIPVR